MVMDARVDARHQGHGIWLFTCLLHASPARLQVVSAPKEAIQVMKGHVDKEHPGKRFRLYRNQEYYSTYTGKVQART